MENKLVSIRKKVFYISLIITVMAGVIMLLGVSGLLLSNQFLESLFPINQKMVKTVRINSHFELFQNNLENYFIISDERHRIATEKELDSTIHLLKELIAEDYRLSLADDTIDRCNSIKRSMETLFNSREMTSRYRNELTASLYREINETSDLLTALLNEFPRNLQDMIERQRLRSIAIVVVYGTLTLLMVLLYTAMGMKLSRDISKPITDLTKVTGEIINGNMDIAIEPRNNDEIGILTIAFSEMTSRLKESLKQLQESERKYRTLFDREGDAIIIFNPESGRIIDANHSTTEIYGYVKKQLLEMIFDDLVLKEKDPHSGLGGGEYDLHIKKNGDIFPVETNLYNIRLGEEELKFVVSRDITEKLHMEELIIQSEKMMSIGGLAAGMAHEINNPLSSIISITNNVLNRLGATTRKMPANRECAEKLNLNMDDFEEYLKQRGIVKMLNTILDSGKRINEIITSMLGFSRRDALHKTMNSMSRLMDDTLLLVSTNRYFKKIKVIKEYDERSPQVFCDPGRIQQVLFNILNNGAQAMEESGAESPSFILDIHPSEDRQSLITTISDNGTGINPENKKRIFEPFFTTKEKGKGTGLGLPISYFIVTEYHGGKMDVESSPGKGASFTITLPVSPSIDQNQH